LHPRRTRQRSPAFPFEDVPEAFTMMTTKDDGIIKPLITFA
jgi:hypothetical protein